MTCAEKRVAEEIASEVKTNGEYKCSTNGNDAKFNIRVRSYLLRNHAILGKAENGIATFFVFPRQKTS